MPEKHWWYGKPLPPEGVIFTPLTTLCGHWRIVPKFYIDVRAYLNPIGDDPKANWEAAEKWFEEQGCCWTSDERFEEVLAREGAETESDEELLIAFVKTNPWILPGCCLATT